MTTLHMLDAGVREDTPPVQPIEFPCTLAQERFWVLDRIEPGTAALNVAVRWQLDGIVVAEIVERAFAAIIERHEVLRTAIVEIDGVPIQRLAPAVTFKLSVIDLTRLAEPDRMRELLSIGAKEARSSFDLSKPLLIRATLVRLAAQRCILLVTAHHIVCDGWSIGILAREFGRLYDAIRHERPARLPELALQYGDYAEWQRRRLASEVLRPARAFWTRQLGGMRQFQVPPDRPRPALQTDNGAIVSSLLPRDLTNGLASLSRAHGATLFATALSGLLVLLHRYTGETDVSIGTQVAGRDEVELEGMVGLFINTVILRNQVTGDLSFGDLLARVRDTVQGALTHQQMPIEEVVQIVRPARDLSRNALFSVNFIFQRSFIHNETYEDFALVDIPSQSAGAMYDLNFFMVERPDGWRLSCEYNTDLFEQVTVQSMLDALRQVFCSVTLDMRCAVSRIPLLSEAERKLIADRNDTARVYPAEMTVLDLIDAAAARTPELTAVACDGKTLTYAELACSSNQVARHLIGHGAGRGSRIGICMNRSVEMVTALVGVLKAGAAYVPLDPRYPAARLAQIMQDAALSEIVTSSDAWERSLPCAARVTMLDRDAEEIAGEDHSAVPRVAAGGDTVYVIFTSGSTGRPKGVPITHRSLTNLLWAMRAQPGLTADDTLLAVTTISFDIAALEIFLPLIAGARLVIASAEQAADGGALRHLLDASRATVMQATPVTWEILIEAGWNGLPRLRALCGGEALPRRLADRLLERTSELWNMYGPTETTIWSSALRVTAGEGPVPIGPPIANTQFHVLDSYGSPMPSGAIGELYIGGDGVAAGYFERPELTRERFVPDHFAKQPHGRLYRTGDLVRRRADGAFEFLGRTDHQIKLRGFRIELGEIEATLLAHPSVAAAVVTLRRDASAGDALCAYVVPEPASSMSGKAAAPDLLVRDIAASLTASLPAHMVPSSFHILPALPRTPNGKIDRGALPDPAPPVPLAAAGTLDATEQRIAAIWRDVLGTEVIDPEANFFELGGHSLLAARMLGRLESAFGEKVGLTVLFRTPTLRGLARLVAAQRPVVDEAQIVQVQPSGSEPPIFALYNTGIFYTLANRLGRERPFIAIQLLDPEKPQSLPERSLQEIAAEYVRAMRSVRPHGPYIVLGLCIAGVIAYEVARQLQADGEEVSLLIVIDAWAPGYVRQLSRRHAFLADISFRAQVIGAELVKVARGRLGFLEWCASKRIVRRIGVLKAAARLGIIRPVPLEPDLWLVEYLTRAIRSYEPQGYDGRTLLFYSPEQPSGRFLDRTLGWRRVCTGPLDCVVIPGDHLGLFQDPGATLMANRILAEIGLASDAESSELAARYRT